MRTIAQKLKRGDLLELICALTILITLGAIVHAIAFGHSVSWNGGCGDDGTQYCLIARGRTASAGFSQRILLPSIVRALPISAAAIPTAFKTVNVISLLVLAGEAWYLTRTLALGAGGSSHRANVVGVISASVVLLMPFGFHWTWFYPVLVDNFAGAIGIGWLIAVTSRSEKVRWLGPPLAMLAVLARESWLIVIVVVSVVELARGRGREKSRAVPAASIVACFVALTIGFLQPKLPNPLFSNWFRFVITELRYDLTPGGLARISWSVLFSLGMIPFIVLRRPKSFFARPARDASRERDILVLAVVMIAAQAATALLGSDSHRYLFPAAPLIVAIIFSRIAVEPDREFDLFVALAASVVLWQPFRALDGTRLNYFDFFSPMFLGGDAVRMRLVRDLARLTIPLGLAAFVYVTRTWIDQRRKTELGSLDRST